jgi:hypothetical protein
LFSFVPLLTAEADVERTGCPQLQEWDGQGSITKRCGTQQSGDSNFHVRDAHEAPGHPEFQTKLNSALNLSVAKKFMY